jgi:hypothetical protein
MSQPKSRANPRIVSRIVSHNGSAVKIYNATSSLMRFDNKNVFFYFEKRSSLVQHWRCSCSCKFRSRRIGSWMENRNMHSKEIRHTYVV